MTLGYDMSAIFRRKFLSWRSYTIFGIDPPNCTTARSQPSKRVPEHLASDSDPRCCMGVYLIDKEGQF